MVWCPVAPLVASIAMTRRRATASATTTAADTVSSGRRPPLLPLFVAGFLAAIALASTGVLPSSVLHVAKVAQEVLLAAALFGLGTGIHFAVLRRTGGRALSLGLLSWLLVGVVAYTGVRLLGT